MVTIKSQNADRAGSGSIDQRNYGFYEPISKFNHFRSDHPMNVFEGLSYNWFFLYYLSLALLFLITGLIWAIRPSPVKSYVLINAGRETRPPLLITLLRYFLLFTIVSLFFSFFPFSWIELAFTIWCLGVVYVIGSYLLRWELIRGILIENGERINGMIRKLGATMMAVGVLIFMLCLMHLDKGR